MRSRRVISSSRCGRPAPAFTIACSIGSSSPRVPVANTARCQTFASSGGSSRTIRRPRSPVTERPQRSMRVATSPASRVGASNALPSRRPRNASATSVAVRTFGGGAGVSSWRAPSRQIASTMPVSAERVSARASTSWSSASSDPGIVSIKRARRAGSTRAGVQRTEYEPFESRARAAAPRSLAQERNHRAACGELDGPDRDPAQPAHARADAFDLTGARRDEPAEHVADGDRLRVGLGAARQRHRAVAGPARGRRAGCRRASRPARRREPAAALRPAAHATTRPGSHDTCTSTTPGSRSRSSRSSRPSRSRAVRARHWPTAGAVVDSARRCPVWRAHASARRRCSDSRSAMTCSRSSPRSDARARRGAPRRRAATPAARRATRPDRPAAPRVVRAWRRRRPRHRRTCRTATARCGVGVGVPVTDLRWIRRRTRRASSKKCGPENPSGLRWRLGADRDWKPGRSVSTDSKCRRSTPLTAF